MGSTEIEGIPLCKHFRPDGRPSYRIHSSLRFHRIGPRIRRTHLRRNCHNAPAFPHRTH